MVHGIGRVVVTFKTLPICRYVKAASTPVWKATLRQILNRLSPITRYHWDRSLRLLTPLTPPVRVGRAAAPWILISTAKLGKIVSNIKNSEADVKFSKEQFSYKGTNLEWRRILHNWRGDRWRGHGEEGWIELALTMWGRRTWDWEMLSRKLMEGGSSS